MTGARSNPQGRTGVRAALGGALKSPTLRVSVGYALAGVGWVAANLAMARLLQPEGFGFLTLMIAIVQTAGPLAPLGADGLARRGTLAFDRVTLLRTLLTCAVMAALAGVAGRGLYSLPWVAAVAVFLGAAAGGIATMAASQLQALHRFGVALFVSQAHLWALAAAAAFVLISHEARASLAALAFGAIYLLIALAGCRWAVARGNHAALTATAFRWRDALRMVLIQAADTVFYQIDRLLIPRLLNMLELATYGVVTSVAASPFRTLQMGTASTLVPRLRTCRDSQARRALLLEEGKRLAFVSIAGAIAILVITRPVIRIVASGKYPVDQNLVVAMVVMGLARVCDGLGMAMALAAAENRQLGEVGLGSWVTLAIAAGGATLGAHWGLVGVVYGLATGWLIRAGLAAGYGARTWRRSQAF